MRLESLNYRLVGRRYGSTTPYMDVDGDAASFSIPQLKWRELVFIGALVRDGEHFVRDPSRTLSSFRLGEFFPEGVRFRVEIEGERVRIQVVEPT